MKTQNLIIRSAVTVVATGLTLLSSGTAQAHGQRAGGLSGGRSGSINHGAIQQTVMSHAITRGRGIEAIVGRSRMDERRTSQARGGDDGRGERERGDDHGGRGERERRHHHDDGVRHDVRDDKGERGERERGDDRGGRGEREHRQHEAGDDRGAF